MHDDAGIPRQRVQSFRTYQEARSVKEMLRQLGIPSSEVELRVRGLKLVSPANSLAVATVFGLALVAASPLLGIAVYALGSITWAAAAAVALYASVLLLVTVWSVRRVTAHSAGGYAIPAQVDLVVTPAYSDEARRVLAASLRSHQRT